MSYEERKQLILGELEFSGRLSFHEIERLVDVSPTTIRRDLTRMNAEGVVERYHGGVKIANEVVEYSMRQKQSMHSDEKCRIGTMAASFLAPNELIFIGGGSTTYTMIDHIFEKSISVITNSVPHAEALHRKGIRTFLLCGFLRTRTRCLGGSETVRLMSQYRFDRAFMGSGGIGDDLSLLSSDQDEFDIKRTALENSSRSYILVDGSKFGLTAMYQTNVSPYPDVHYITDNESIGSDRRVILV